MTNKIRVFELEQNLKYWQDAQIAVEEIRDSLLNDQLNGLTMINEEGKDVLPDRVRAVDKTVLYHEKCQFLLRALLKKARAVDKKNNLVRLNGGKFPKSSKRNVRSDDSGIIR